MGLVEPIAPTDRTLFGPRGAALGSEAGPLFVCDTGHHRLLVWNGLPDQDGSPADHLIGQPDFRSEGRNARGLVGAATLNVPTGVSAEDGVLAVADAWNHRVLIWHGYPARSNQPADVVLGQRDFVSNAPNRGCDMPSAASLNWCYGVAIANGALYVADTGNRRVLKWNRIPEADGTPADLVLGQDDFETRDENGGRMPGAAGMRWPHGVATDGDRLFVADAGNNRIMVWDAPPGRNGTPSAFVLGQRNARGVDHNQAAYYPTAASLNMPYGVAVLDRKLVATDTANCRIVGYDLDDLAMEAPAHWLAGQTTFEDKGENRWSVPQRDSLCWPYGISVSGTMVVVADSGNNRVLVWEAIP
ncbi:MAG: NHL repeat-containing protein [Hyphomicrobium sp.]|uniref:NHL repeat-containing protein n=1 Tax=Hyphomicrobium sp. TaxID=82 RepID=UPI003D0A21AA